MGEVPDLGVIQRLLNTVDTATLLWGAMMILEAVMAAAQEHRLHMGRCLRGQL